MAPWKTPDRDQLTAKYLISPFALMQPAWPPRSNGVSCTRTTGRGLPFACQGGGVGLPASTSPAHPPTAHPHSPTRTCGLSPLAHACAAPAAAHRRRLRRTAPASPREAVNALRRHTGQRGQPLGCFTTCRGSLSPMKYICGSARGDKLLNCVCGRFMVRRDGGGQAGDAALPAAIPQLAGPSRLRGRQGSPRRGHGGDHMQSQRE